MSDRITVVVNGEDTAVAAGATVADLLAQLELGSKWVIVERNGEPVPRDEHGNTRLSAGDRVELVRAVAGG